MPGSIEKHIPVCESVTSDNEGSRCSPNQRKATREVGARAFHSLAEVTAAWLA